MSAFFKKLFASLLAALQLFFYGVVLGDLQPKPPAGRPQENIVNNIAGDSNLSPSVLYAAELKNAVQGIYTNSDRTQYALSNAQMTLTHNLTAKNNKTATLTNAKGGVYLADTLDTFYTTTTGETYFAAVSQNNARPNTIRLGEYYYESRIRDLDFAKQAGGLFQVDKGYHVYGDRLYQELALYASQATDKLASFGVQTVIPASKVEALEIRDANGVTDDLSAYTAQSVEYAAFLIQGVGVVGFIIPSDGSTASLRVTLENGNYTVVQTAAFAAGTGVNKNDETGGYALNKVTFGSRIYTDESTDFTGIAQAAALERNPLQSAGASGGNANAEYLQYEALRGSYLFRMDGTDFGTAYANPDVQYSAPITFTGDAQNRDIYVRMNGKIGCLEAGALLDDNGTLAAMDVQVCKNFQGDGGEPFYSVKDYMYGDSIFPLRVPAHETLQCTLLNLYQSWGKYPLKQLSSIEFHVSYYHLSTGATESNCIAPYFVYGKDGWVLPDFRGCSGDIWTGQPQFNSVGRLYFVKYRKGLTQTVGSEYTGSVIQSSGLNYSDILYSYTSDCGSYDYTLRHVEFPQTDENRTYYELSLTFNRDMTFRDFKNDFSLFSFDGRAVSFQKVEYLGEDNQPQTKTPRMSILPTTETIVLGKEVPYFGYYNITDKDVQKQKDNNFGANFGLVVKSSNITIGGKKWDGNFAFKNSYDGKLNTGALTLNESKLEIKAGDSINVQLILLPWGTISEKKNGTVEKVREDSALKALTATAAIGTIQPDAYVPIIRSENNVAEFTLTGGRGNNSVRINGFTSNACPKISEWDGSEWQEISLASINGYDGYTVYYDKLSGLYDFAFTYTAADPDTAYRFRCEQ